MNSILNKTINEIEVKKSKFIALATPVNTESEIHDILKSLKKEYVGANHYTYAYTLGDTGNIQKASDDGEPTRTAGFPILEIISKNNLTNILIVIIRFFGGTKLGAGGLIRAYSGSASEVVKLVTLTKKITTYECLVTCSYDNLGSIDQFIRDNTNLINVAYDSVITFTFKIDSLEFEEVKSHLFNRNNYEDNLKVLNEYSEYA